MTTVRIQTGPAEARIYFPYDQAIIDAVKTIPGRRYVDGGPNGKFWSVPTFQAEAARDLLTSMGHTVLYDGTSASPTSDATMGRLRAEMTALQVRNRQLVQENQRLKREAEAKQGDWATSLLRRCPPELEEKVFRALTRVLHPDTGGDNDLMRDLNVARDRLAQRV